MKKFLIGISVLIFVVLVVLFINRDKSFKCIATVTDIISFSSSFVNVNLDIENNGKSIGTAVIDSTIFNVGDKLEVEGIKKDELIINKIKFLGTTKKEKSSIISNCDDDVKLLDYKSRINITIKQNDGEGIGLMKIHNLPIKLKNQEYDLNISPLEYFEIKYENMDYEYVTISDFSILFTSEDNFTVKEVTANYDDKKENLEYKFEDNTITFKSVGSVIYSVIIEYENGDIINYLFA